MLGKMEIRSPPGSRPRDGRHCDLCGCSQPAVRCDKCGCQIFCLSCDDMYHRHPKRRFHLRKAVDPTPPNPQARPVLPMKVSQLGAANPGDPSKMPLPPPRKKKTSLFGSFRKPNTPSDNSPPLPKKEYSWTDRLGSIKKFMSNRPLPPLPNPDDNRAEQQLTTNGQSAQGDLSFIHRRSEERPPQLPHRSPRSPEFPGSNQERENRIPISPGPYPGQIRNGGMEQNTNHVNQNQAFNASEDNQWNGRSNNQNGFGTLNRHGSQRGFVPPGAPGYPGGMHQSSSATDLHSLQHAEGIHGPVPPHYPHYPVNPHMPPHYPYPMYPQYHNYPQYFGNSFANLSNPPTSEGDFSDSESSARPPTKRHAFRKRAKRSQSVMMDRMAYPGQFFPFGPYPGYGPWGAAPMPMEAPPSPASSIRSLNRAGRSRRRKKTTSEDEDEEFSVSSSPMSRTKSSSSDPKEGTRAPLATQTTSSEDESDEDAAKRRNKINTVKRQLEPERISSPVAESSNVTRLKKSSSRQSDSETRVDSRNEKRPSVDTSTESPLPAAPKPPTPSASPDSWECKHCTFINPIANRICQVCCKTASSQMAETPHSRPSSAAPATSKRNESACSGQVCSSPEQFHEAEEDTGKQEKHDMASLNSALDEAEKQISKGLEELMKLKDDIDANASKEKTNSSPENQTQPETQGNSKPVYKPTGRMRTSILDKLNLNRPQASVSTSTETQTIQNNWTSDKIIEARRYSNSSTTSTDAYNSPMAQSPELERGFLGNRQKRDSSCQTQQDSLTEYLEKKRAAEEAFLGRPISNFGFGYGDRMDMVTSPVPSMYDRFFGGGYGGGMMQRSHSRASLFTGRVNDFAPMDYGGPGFGYGPTPMYRSVSRGSLTGDYPEGRMSDFHNLRKPDYYLSMEELVERRRQDNIRAQGLELVRMIREAEQQGFNADDIQVALTHCGKQNPLEWLQDNWRNMVDSVITLSTNYGNDKKENDIGLLSENEARDALRLHKGNIWAAVTECVESRQRKYLELNARGNFSRQDIVDSLTASDGDVEMAYAKLTKSSGKPFLMRIWGAGEGAQNQDGAQPMPEDFQDRRHRFYKDETINSDEMSEELWSEDGDWDEEDEYEGERTGDIEDLQTCREDLPTSPQEMMTPESDRSDYCDAFPVVDRNASSPSDDLFFILPEAKPEKKKGFLSKLSAFRKDSKELKNVTGEDLVFEERVQSKEDSVSLNSNSTSDQTKNSGALNVLKSTFSAIKDTVTGSVKSEKKIPCSQPDKRTIVVKEQLDQVPLNSDSKNDLRLISVKRLDEDYSLSIKSEKEHDEPPEQAAGFLNKGTTQIPDNKAVKTDLKDSSQMMQTNKKDLAESNGPESVNKVEIKKPQSLAERLKFAKQNRAGGSTSSASISQQQNNILDTNFKETISIKETANTENKKVKINMDDKNENTSNQEEITTTPEKNDQQLPLKSIEIKMQSNFSSNNTGKSADPAFQFPDSISNTTAKIAVPLNVQVSSQECFDSNQIKPLNQNSKQNSSKLKSTESKALASIEPQSLSPVSKTPQREKITTDDTIVNELKTSVSRKADLSRSKSYKDTQISDISSEINKTTIDEEKSEVFEDAQSNLTPGSTTTACQNSDVISEKNKASATEVSDATLATEMEKKETQTLAALQVLDEAKICRPEMITNENMVAEKEVSSSEQEKKIDDRTNKEPENVTFHPIQNSSENAVVKNATNTTNILIATETDMQIIERSKEAKEEISKDDNSKRSLQTSVQVENRQVSDNSERILSKISENNVQKLKLPLGDVSADEKLLNVPGTSSQNVPEKGVEQSLINSVNPIPETNSVRESQDKMQNSNVTVGEKYSVMQDDISKNIQVSQETAIGSVEGVVSPNIGESNSEMRSITPEKYQRSESAAEKISSSATESNETEKHSNNNENSRIKQSMLEKKDTKESEDILLSKTTLPELNGISTDTKMKGENLLLDATTNEPMINVNITKESTNEIESESQREQKSTTQLQFNSGTDDVPSSSKADQIDIQASLKESESEQGVKSLKKISQNCSTLDIKIESSSAEDKISDITSDHNHKTESAVAESSQNSNQIDASTEIVAAEITDVETASSNTSAVCSYKNAETSSINVPNSSITPKPSSSVNISKNSKTSNAEHADISETTEISLSKSASNEFKTETVSIGNTLDSSIPIISSNMSDSDNSKTIATSSLLQHEGTAKAVETSQSKTISNVLEKTVSIKSISNSSEPIESPESLSVSDTSKNSEASSPGTSKIDTDAKSTKNDSAKDNAIVNTSISDSSKSEKPSTSVAVSDHSQKEEVSSCKTVEPVSKDMTKETTSTTAEKTAEQHSNVLQIADANIPSSSFKEQADLPNVVSSNEIMKQNTSNDISPKADDSEDSELDDSDESRPSSVTPPSPVDALRNRFEILAGGSIRGNPNRPASPFRRMSFNSRKQVIALEKKRDVTADKPWFREKIVHEPAKIPQPKRTIKQQLEMERKVRKMVADRKCRTYRKAEIIVQLMDMNFEEEEAIQAANECSTLEQAISYLQQECLLCTGNYPVSQIVSMTHCQHRACRECIRAYFTVQIRDRTILDLICPFCNEPDMGDEDIAQDYFNHLDIMLKKLVDGEIHELFQRKLRDRVLMKDPNFRWCSQCSSGFIAMPNLKRLICPDCNAITCASCRRLWEKEHQGISCEAFAALKDASDPEAQAAGLAKMLTEDGIDCPSCHFRYALAKGGCMHFRCIQCQHDFCSGCSRPFKMGQKCGVSEFCGKLGLHAHHPRNCLFYLRDKEPEDLQKLLDMNDVKYNRDLPDGMELRSTCQVMEQKETSDGMVDDYCGKEVQEGFAGLCRVHYVEYLGQLVNKHRVDPIQIFDNDDLELVLRRANIRLPPKKYRESDVHFREKLVKLIEDELPLDKMDGS